MTVQESARAELERLQSIKIRRPVRVNGARPAGGEWDWFYDLPRGERAAIARDFMDPESSWGPDDVATIMATSIDSAMTHWVACVRLARKSNVAASIDDGDVWGDEDDRDVGPGRTVALGDLVGISEVADICCVQRATVDMWRRRGVMPEPLTTISGSPIWSWLELEPWAEDTGRL